MSRPPHATGCRVTRLTREGGGILYLVCDAAFVRFSLRGNALWAKSNCPRVVRGRSLRPTDPGIKALVRAAIGTRP